MSVQVNCWCMTCESQILEARTMNGESTAYMFRRFIVCPDCGNKRCPRATHHDHACSGSNEPGQVGSVYGVPPMTAPPRIPHGEAVRNAVRVEWMRLETTADLAQAKAWLSAHGVKSMWGFTDSRLVISVHRSEHMGARLGQVLAFVPESGEFSVWEWPHFVAAHPGVSL